MTNFQFDIYCQVISKTVSEIFLKTKLEYSHESYSTSCDEWIQKYSLETKTNWIVKSTYPNKQRYLYRKDYVCQHSSRNKTLLNLSNSNRTRLRNMNCNAIIKIIVKKDTADTRKKDKYIRQGLNTEIKVSVNVLLMGYVLSCFYSAMLTAYCLGTLLFSILT